MTENQFHLEAAVIEMVKEYELGDVWVQGVHLEKNPLKYSTKTPVALLA